jgi:hypothetical protein
VTGLPLSWVEYTKKGMVIQEKSTKRYGSVLAFWRQPGKKKDIDQYQFKSCTLGQKTRLLTTGKSPQKMGL